MQYNSVSIISSSVCEHSDIPLAFCSQLSSSYLPGPHVESLSAIIEPKSIGAGGSSAACDAKSDCNPLMSESDHPSAPCLPKEGFPLSSSSKCQNTVSSSSSESGPSPTSIQDDVEIPVEILLLSATASFYGSEEGSVFSSSTTMPSGSTSTTVDLPPILDNAMNSCGEMYIPLCFGDTPANVANSSNASRFLVSFNTSIHHQNSKSKKDASSDVVPGPASNSTVQSKNFMPFVKLQSKSSDGLHKAGIAPIGEEDDVLYQQTIADGCMLMYAEISNSKVGEAVIRGLYLNDRWFTASVLVYAMCVALRLKKAHATLLPTNFWGDDLTLLALLSLSCKLHGDIVYSSKALSAALLEARGSSSDNGESDEAYPLAQQLNEREWSVWSVAGFNFNVVPTEYESVYWRVMALGA